MVIDMNVVGRRRGGTRCGVLQVDGRWSTTSPESVVIMVSHSSCERQHAIEPIPLVFIANCANLNNSSCMLVEIYMYTSTHPRYTTAFPARFDTKNTEHMPTNGVTTK